METRNNFSEWGLRDLHGKIIHDVTLIFAKIANLFFAILVLMRMNFQNYIKIIDKKNTIKKENL